MCAKLWGLSYSIIKKKKIHIYTNSVTSNKTPEQLVFVNFRIQLTLLRILRIYRITYFINSKFYKNYLKHWIYRKSLNMKFEYVSILPSDKVSKGQWHELRKVVSKYPGLLGTAGERATGEGVACGLRTLHKMGKLGAAGTALHTLHSQRTSFLIALKLFWEWQMSLESGIYPECLKYMAVMLEGVRGWYFFHRRDFYYLFWSRICLLFSLIFLISWKHDMYERY